MRFLLAIMVVTLSTVAFADYPTSIELEPKRAPIVGGYLTARLPVGMMVESDRPGEPVELRTSLTWWGTRFSMSSYELGTCGGALRLVEREVTKQGIDLAQVRITPIESSLGGYAVIPRQQARRVREAVVYTAYLATTPTTIQVFAFFVDESGLGQSTSWATLAARVAASVRIGDSVRSTVVQTKLDVTLPADWCFVGQRQLMYYTLRAPDGARCELSVGAGRGPIRIHGATLVHGLLLGAATNWITWVDRAGHHADAASGELDARDLHVRCTATTASALAALRGVVATIRWKTSP